MTPSPQASGMIPMSSTQLNNLVYTGINSSHEDFIYAFVTLSKPLLFPVFSFRTAFLILTSVIALSRSLVTVMFGNSGLGSSYYLLQLVFSACVAAVKSRPVLHHCVFIFFWSSGIMKCTCMLSTFENGVPLMR